MSRDRARRLRDQLMIFQEMYGITIEEIVAEQVTSRNTIIKLRRLGDDDNFDSATLDAIENYISKTRKERGITNDSVYAAVSGSINAELDNSEFLEHYSGAYRVLRAHVPSKRPLVSRLEILRPAKGVTIKYRHTHVVSDALSLFDNVDTNVKIVFEGVVFNCGSRAFLISGSWELRHLKQMVLNLRPGLSFTRSTIRGLLLTMSADERQPFAARILLQKEPDKTDLDNDPRWELGLKDSWNEFPKEVREVFDEKDDFGVLHIHP